MRHKSVHETSLMKTSKLMTSVQEGDNYDVYPNNVNDEKTASMMRYTPPHDIPRTVLSQSFNALHIALYIGLLSFWLLYETIAFSLMFTFAFK